MSQTSPEIGTLEPASDLAPSPPCGEPRRPGVVWFGAGAFWLGVAVAVSGMLTAFYRSILHFPEAAWLHGVVPSKPGDLLRVALASGLFTAVLLSGAAAIIAGYYGWRGYSWARWAGLIAVAVSALLLTGNLWMQLAMIPIALGAAAWWLPQSRWFFDAWQTRRHPAPLPTPPPETVSYGPLPKYRT